MKAVDCRAMQEALATRDRALLDAVAEHAQSCVRCREHLRIWEAMSESAPSLRKEWESPRLWPNIREALRREQESPRRVWGFGSGVGGLRWVPAAAIVLLFVIAGAGVWVFRGVTEGRDPLVAGPWRYQDALMTEQAFEEVERRERDYLESIDRLSQVVAPRLRQQASPLFESYREKILVLDAAIGDIRAEIDRNQFNTHLRRELLAMYAEKQRTLQDLMKEAQS
jgi:hypothetical protein